MQDYQVGLVLMVGGGGQAQEVERVLRRARQAAALDIIDQALEIPQFDPIIVLSDDDEWMATLVDRDVRLVSTARDSSFHFGASLCRLIENHGLERCCYMGGGSAPLLTTSALTQIALQLLRDEPVLVTNNLYSSDWAAFSPANALSPSIRLLERDNAVAWVWQEHTSYPVEVLPRTASTQMDIDTPFDLLAISRHPSVHPHLRAFLDGLDWPATNLDAALDVLRREASQVIVAGRVSSWLWQLMEQRTRAWVRVYSEERGMRASGRQARGEVRSLLGDYLEHTGVQSFFERLAEMADAVFLDSRVILASRGLWPSDADRFYSDLLMSAQIQDPFLRALTAAAASAPIPVVLGGHSLVSGGLALLLDGPGFKQSD